MRNVLCIIVLALGVTTFASCAKSIHSQQWYERHHSAMTAMLKRCYYNPAIDPNCSTAIAAHHALREAMAKKVLKRFDRENPFAGIRSYVPPPPR